MVDTLDETKAKFLQDVYFILRDNSPESAGIVLSWLEQEVKIIAEILARIQARKTDYILPATIQVPALAASRFIEMYLKNSEWECRSFRNRIYLEVLFFLYGPNTMRAEQYLNIVNTDVSELNISNAEEEKKEDIRTVIEDIRALKDGDKIILICSKAESYKKFILKIAEFLPRRKIYDFAVRFRLLYKNTRRK